MKKITVTPLVMLAIVFIILGLIIAAVPKNTTKQFKLTPEKLLQEVQEGYQYMTTSEIADKIINKDPSIQLIDVRSQSDYESYHLPGAINIPISEILLDKYVDVLNQNIKMNILYSNSSNTANEAWMILRQLDYENNYILQGGLNYWAETIINPQKPSNMSSNEEIAKYDFCKAAGASLYGANKLTTVKSDNTNKIKPKRIRKRKKKAADGGC